MFSYFGALFSPENFHLMMMMIFLRVLGLIAVHKGARSAYRVPSDIFRKMIAETVLFHLPTVYRPGQELKATEKSPVPPTFSISRLYLYRADNCHRIERRGRGGGYKF